MARVRSLACALVGLGLALAAVTPVGHAAPGAKTAAKTAATKGSAKAGSKLARSTPKKPSAAAMRAERLGLGTVKAAGALLAGRPEAQWVRAAGGVTALPGTLRFPVAKGWFVRGFGSGKGGYHQAMDIGGEIGWNVRAAAPGLVGYASDGVAGYGNLVLVIHAGGWVTAYGHNAENLVVAGQKVDRGSVLAELGSTGRSKGPHVHFELLWNGQNCDPGPLFRPGARHRSGKPAHVERASWSQPTKRPKAVVCHPRKHHPDYVEKDEADEVDDEPEAANATAPAGGASTL